MREVFSGIAAPPSNADVIHEGGMVTPRVVPPASLRMSVPYKQTCMSFTGATTANNLLVPATRQRNAVGGYTALIVMVTSQSSHNCKKHRAMPSDKLKNNWFTAQVAELMCCLGNDMQLNYLGNVNTHIV